MVRIVRAGPATRRAAAVLPVLALATGGIAFAATSDNPATTSLTVPDRAITQGASPRYPEAGPAPAPMQLPPIYDTYTRDWARVGVPAQAAEAVRALGELAPVRLDADGIPSVALAAYRHVATRVGRLDPGCGVDWALLGAIGRVESNHARFGGNVLDPAGVARPGIIGIPLDGSGGTSRITDTDHGALDHDTVYDRAVGPMQFIPTTWSVAGRDGDGDGLANPQDLSDSVTAAAVVLCSGGSDVRDPGAAYRAVLRYNHSDQYARSVLSIADAYRRGVTVVPVGSIPAARPASGSGTATPDGSGFGYAGSPGSGSTSPAAGQSASPGPGPSRPSKPSPKSAPKPSAKSSPEGRPAPTAPGPGSAPKPAPGLPVPALPDLPPVQHVPLPTPSAPPPPAPTLPDAVQRLLALPPLPRVPGDPAGLVRVRDPLTAGVVCLLDRKVVTCP